MTPPKPNSRALVSTEGSLPGSFDTLAEDQRIMELSLQRVTDRQENHEKACLDNQRRIEDAFKAVNGRLDGIAGTLTSVVSAQTTSAAVSAAALTGAKPKWWQQAIFAAVVGLIGWMGSTIWNMQNEKITALQSRPAAAVTVNPAQAPPAQPAAVYPGPILPANPAPPDPTTP